MPEFVRNLDRAYGMSSSRARPPVGEKGEQIKRADIAVKIDGEQLPQNAVLAVVVLRDRHARVVPGVDLAARVVTSLASAQASSV